MRTLLLAAAAVLALGSAAPASAGEGNGPSFPGLNAVSTGITTRLSDGYTTTSTTLLADASGTGPSLFLPSAHPMRDQARAMIASLSGLHGT